MEMHQLRYVLAVARTGNFTRASELCNVSQPSLSQQIQKLEDELGERLFERMKRSVKPTPHGAVFLQRAARILDEVAAAKREAEDAKGLLSGTVAVGILPTIAPYLLPEAIAGISKEHPGVEIVVQEDITANLLKQSLAYEIDIAIVSDIEHDARFETRELLEEELLLALPPAHRLACKRSITLSDLETERFIVMQEGHCLGDQVLGFCSRREPRPAIGFRSAQLETIQALIRAGLGVSLIPAMATKAHDDNRLVYRSIQEPKPRRKITALWPKQRPQGRAADMFLKAITSQLANTRA